VLVASDAMTRGMDVHVIKNVVNYDAPVYVKTYVHRCVVKPMKHVFVTF
jgi:ATP-dependent RNA helicase DDX51/DBP6